MEGVLGLNEIFLIGNNIRRFRKSKGLSQKEVARILNISQSTYSRYENNIIEPSNKEMDQLCELFEITKYELIVDEKTAAEHGFILPKAKLDASILTEWSPVNDVRENTTMFIMLESQKLNEKGLSQVLHFVNELTEQTEYLYYGENNEKKRKEIDSAETEEKQVQPIDNKPQGNLTMETSINNNDSSENNEKEKTDREKKNFSTDSSI